ncbi:MAG: SDR family NAD(P)-dependent oxidoreductase [Nocardioidaceae bacterium]
MVNNAGTVRDRMLVNATEDEWDAVIRGVHIEGGHFAPLRHAASYWRAESKAGRERVARVINTSSGAGLQGSIGQTAYSAAKAGIMGMTLVAAAELSRVGVAVNAIAPVGRTRMTEGAFPDMMAESEDAFDAMDSQQLTHCGWLASTDCDNVTGRVIEIEGGQICQRDRLRCTDPSATWVAAGPPTGGFRRTRDGRRSADARAGVRHQVEPARPARHRPTQNMHVQWVATH